MEPVAIIGAPGSGKSTVLKSVCVRGYSHDSKPARMVTARELVKSGACLPEKSFVLIDGLDELGLTEQNDLARVLDDAGDCVWWVACRSDFFARVTPLSTQLKRCRSVMELQPLRAPDAATFLTQLSSVSPQCAAASEAVTSWLLDPRFAGLARTPLALTMAFFITLRGDGAENPPNSRFELFSRYYRSWLWREQVEFGLSSREVQAVRSRHEKVARQIYRVRQSAARDQVRLRAFGGKPEVAFLSLLDYTREGRTIQVRDFVHETLLEFVLASTLANEFLRDHPADDALDLAANDDVHTLVRECLATWDRRTMTSALENLALAFSDADSARVKEHIIYYVGRLGLSTCPELLTSTYWNNDEDRLLRRSAALGAILYGDLDVEADYLSRLQHDEDEARLNRAVQLVYFGDQIGDLHNAVDHGGEWSRTRSALLERIGSDSERAHRLRWWDVFTFRDFCRTRHADLTEQEQAVFGAVDLSGDSRRQSGIRGLIGAMA